MSELRKAAQQALEALKIAEAGLADIGDADREPGDDVAWCEARAADALAAPRSAIIALRAAFAQPEQEPVAWMYEGEPYFDGKNFVKTYRYTDSKELAEFKSGTIKKPQPLYTAPPQRKPLAEPVQEPVASVTECEACFTPDVCQLRGTCDHYAAERLRVAAPPQREPVHQWRKQMCADWYDGHPDHSDGGGPYETRVLYSAPPQRKPLTERELKVMWAEYAPNIGGIFEFARAIERAHGIGDNT